MTKHTTFNMRVDRDLKKEAGQVAKSMGLRLGTIMQMYMRKFVVDREVTFHLPEVPNAKTAAALRKPFDPSDCIGPFSSAGEMRKALLDDK